MVSAIAVALFAAGAWGQESAPRFDDRPAAPKAAPIPGLSHAPSARVVLPPFDWAAYGDEKTRMAAEGAKPGMAIGMVRALPETVSVTAGEPSLGAWRAAPDGGMEWLVTIDAPDAIGLRLEWTQLALPEGATLVVYNIDRPGERFGPYAGLPPGGSVLWTPTVFGTRVVVACHAPPGADLGGVHLRLTQVGQVMTDPMALDKQAGACNQDISCYPEEDAWGGAVAGVGSVAESLLMFCTGALINSTDGCDPAFYFLTANHCVGGQTGFRGADSLEFFWEFQTPACNGTPPNPATDVPRTGGGADYLAGMGGTGFSGGGNDFTLLRLREAPPPGLVRMGWSAEPQPLGAPVTGIHHPRGTFKRVSFGGLTDIDNPHAQWYHEAQWSLGTTEPTSSGSPLLVPGTGQIIGQLWGGWASCTLQAEPDYYGRFDVTYPAVADYLDPPPITAAFVNAHFSAFPESPLAGIQVTLSEPSRHDGASVAYAVTAGSATPGEDFTPAEGALIFNEGEQTKVFAVPLTPDPMRPVSKTVLLSLSGAGCVGLAQDGASATLTLLAAPLPVDPADLPSLRAPWFVDQPRAL